MPSGLWLTSYCFLWILLIVEAVAIRTVLKHVAQLYPKMTQPDLDDAIPDGATAPLVDDIDYYGRPAVLGTVRGLPTILHFVSTGCSSCRTLLPLVGTLRGMDELQSILVVSADKSRTRLYLAQSYIGEEEDPSYLVVTDPDQILFNQYHVRGVPFTVLVGKDGKIIGKGWNTSRLDLESLIRRAVPARRRALSAAGNGR